eukprot:gene28835-34804_t
MRVFDWLVVGTIVTCVLLWLGNFRFEVHIVPIPPKNPKRHIEGPREIEFGNKSFRGYSLEGSRDDKLSKLHIVFSTGCNFYQNWQSLLVFHSAMVVNQPGYITRIASGCLEEEQKEIFEQYKYRVHFTPDYSVDAKSKKSFHYNNKPYGVQHWLANAKPAVSEDTIVVIIDPDMIFLRPITAQIKGNPLNLYLKDFDPTKDTIPLKVQRRVPASALYGIGAPWTTPEYNTDFNRSYICGSSSPCLKVTWAEGVRSYAVGPPYLVHVKDLVGLAGKWAEFMPRVFERHTSVLADMYAYSMAAAHLELPHFTLNSYMVSNINDEEGWAHVDALGKKVCSAMDYVYQDIRKMQSGTYTGKYTIPEYIYPSALLPNFLHYCQPYHVGQWFFHKLRFKQSMMTCDSPLLSSLSPDIASIFHTKHAGKTVEITPRQTSRGGFALCTIHAAINRMLIYYKHKMCRGGIKKANLNMTESDE